MYLATSSGTEDGSSSWASSSVGAGRVAMKASLSRDAWKCRAVDIKKDVSREPWERVRGRKEAWERGVAAPVCCPVVVPVGYIMLVDEAGI
jgi:hypothetical protein